MKRIANRSHGDLAILLALIGIFLATKPSIGPCAALLTRVAFMGRALHRAIGNRVVGADRDL